MDDRRSIVGAVGNLSYRPPHTDGLVVRTVAFVRGQLKQWRDDPKRPKAVGEVRLNSSLCDYLDHTSREEFPMVRFKHESLDAGSRSVDIGVHGVAPETIIGAWSYSLYEPFMVIEAKRLPAPRNDREREYVTGKKANGSATGGIQRFKLGLHGSDVQFAAIVGYVQKGTLESWHGTVNEWITELVGKKDDSGCAWESCDIIPELEVDNDSESSIATSEHPRSGEVCSSPITIYHLWVLMA